jgi:hypothetical protein
MLTEAHVMISCFNRFRKLPGAFHSGWLSLLDRKQLAYNLSYYISFFCQYSSFVLLAKKKVLLFWFVGSSNSTAVIVCLHAHCKIDSGYVVAVIFFWNTDIKCIIVVVIVIVPPYFV